MTDPRDDQARAEPAGSRRFRPRHRIGRDLDYQSVFAARLRKGAGPMLVFAKPNELGFDRLGLSIGRRAGPAVRRTRLKRLVREAFRLSRDDLPGGFDLVVNLRAHRPMPMARYRALLINLAGAAAREQAKRDSKRDSNRERDRNHHGLAEGEGA